MDKAKKNLVVADIFCGAGGMSAGFAEAKVGDLGFDISFGLDHDADAIKSFRQAHFKGCDQSRLNTLAPRADVESFTAKQIEEAIQPGRIDVLIGGPSCQGVSAAGFRNPEDGRNLMIRAYIGMIRELQPDWFVMENVPGLTHSNNRQLLKVIFEELKSIPGYKVAGDMLLAADYGVPQLRYRLFIIGTKTGKPIRFPSATHFLSPMPGEPTFVTVGKALEGIDPNLASIAEANQTVGAEGMLNHASIRVSPPNVKRIRSLRPGDDWRDMPIDLLPDRFFATRSSDQKGAYGRLRTDWPGYTITNAVHNVTAGCFTHPTQDRPLTVREAARLQGFDDTHEFFGTLGSQYRQVGNAVPVGLARAVAQSILECHSSQDSNPPGQKGRLDLQTITDALSGKRSFPVLTPRIVHPEKVKTRRIKPGALGARRGERKSAWDASLRFDPSPEETVTLRTLATQPGNFRAAKRAKAIVAFIDGQEKRKIFEAAKASEQSVRRWIDEYFDAGLEGWRAYHTPTTRISQGVPDLATAIEEAVARVRRMDASRTSDRRIYVNAFLMELVDRYGSYSVSDLFRIVHSQAGVDLGTMYVADLLAIADVILSSKGASNPKDYLRLAQRA